MSVSEWKCKYFILRRFPPERKLSELNLDYYVSRLLENETVRIRALRDIEEYEKEQTRMRDEDT